MEMHMEQGMPETGIRHVVEMDAHMQQCIQECTNCGAVCTEAVMHSLMVGGKRAEQEHIRILLDCAEICRTSADFMLRQSPRHKLTCGVCAEVCERCAEACEALGDDQVMRLCAQACRSCAASCQRMASH